MKRVIVILVLGLVQFSFSASQNPRSNQSPGSKPKIVKQINRFNADGTYTLGFELEDGSFKVETRAKDGSIKGTYGFIDAKGQLRTADYSTAKRSLPLVNSEPGTSATETETLSVRADSRENRASDEKSSSVENSSESTSKESSGEEEPAFNSFNTQPGQKDEGETSELTKRQGQLGGPSGGVIIGSQYPGQGQRFQGSQPYNPTTQLQGGQFVDSRGQGPFGGPQQQYFQGPGPQPQYFAGGPQQYPTGGFIRGSGLPTHYVGRQYPGQYVATSPQFGVSPQGGQFTTQGQLQSQQQDEDGFVNGPPGAYYRGVVPQSESPQLAYNGGQSPQGLTYIRPGYRAGPYVGPLVTGGQQFGGQQLSRFNTSPVGSGAVGPQTFSSGNTGGSRQEYVPNPELDGFSEDNDQDGFVDTYQGNDRSKEAADEKTPAVKAPTGERISGQYSPQVLEPQQILQGQGRPGTGVSPYNEQELQQLYNQQPLRPQTPYVQPQPQLNQFAFQGQQPQFQSYPIQQQYNPQIQFGAPQIRGGSYIPVQGQFAGGVPYQGGPQYAVQGPQQPFILGQRIPNQPFVQGGGNPQFVNVQANSGGPAAQFPYDYVGGVGPNGFPLGGPQVQFVQQPQQQTQQLTPGQGASPVPSQHLTPTQGSIQIQPATSDSKKDGN